MLFHQLLVWRDLQARSGPENMAIDEALMKQVGTLPVLRLYEWEGDWVSLGYFQSLRAAKKVFGEEPNYVRRWTGGGVVDHRHDATYTLIIPRSEPLAGMGGAVSYQKIHEALATCLRTEGHSSELLKTEKEINSVACFEKPVEWDLVNNGLKIAGAGQRRTRHGMLHQGSVALEMSQLQEFPQFLAEEMSEWSPRFAEDLDSRYATKEWTNRVL